MRPEAPTRHAAQGQCNANAADAGPVGDSPAAGNVPFSRPSEYT